MLAELAAFGRVGRVGRHHFMSANSVSQVCQLLTQLAE